MDWASKRGKVDGEPLRAASKTFYSAMAKALREADELLVFAGGGIRPALVHRMLEQVRGHSLHVAQGIRALLARSYPRACLVEYAGITSNPAADVRLPKPKGRLRAATPAEIRHLVAAADALGRHEIGDSIVLGVTTSQRQADRLKLEFSARSESWIRVCQNKTGAVVEVREDPWATARIDAAIERRRSWTVQPLENVIVNERSRRLRRVDLQPGLQPGARRGRRRHREGWRLILPPCPSLAGLRDQDLRDTCITWAIDRGATAEQIASVSGHSVSSVQAMLDRHYGVKTRAQAAAVADKLAGKLRNE